jgi:dynein light chain roadblock-type
MAANSEVDETVKRIMSHKGILGVVIVNNDGIPIRSTLDNVVSVQYAGLVTQLVIKSRSMVRDLQTDNDLQFLRLRSKKHEILIAPGAALRAAAPLPACCSSFVLLSPLSPIASASVSD